MGCTASSNSGHMLAISYKVGKRSIAKTHIAKDVSSFQSIVNQLKQAEPDLRYQFFYFQTEDANEEIVHIDDEFSFKKFVDSEEVKSGKDLKLHLVFRHFEISMPRDSPRFIDIIPRVVKLLDSNSYVDRMGFMLAPQLLITSTMKNNGAKPDVKNFVYHNKKKKLFKGDMDTSMGAFFVNFGDLNLCIMQTEELHTIGFETIRETHHPKNIAYFGSTKNISYLKMCNMRDVSSKGRSTNGIITYDLSDSALTSSATGGVLVDTDTWIPVGIHLKANKSNNQGQGILFNAVLEKLRETKPDGLALFGEVFDLSVRRPSGAPSNPSPDPKRLNPDNENSFHIPIQTITAMARSVGGMIFTRSALLCSPDKNFVVYDGHNKQFHSEPCLEDFAPGVSVTSTFAIAVITGVNTEGEPKALSITKKMDKIEISPPKNQHQFHGSAIVENKLFVIAGRECAAVETYSFSTKEWDSVADLPRCLTHFATAVTENKLYVGGGQIGGEINRASRAIYKFDNGEWNKLSAKLPDRMINHIMTPTTPGSVLVLGGMIADDAYNSKGIEINLETGDSSVRIFSTGPDVKIPPFALSVPTVGTQRHILTSPNEVFSVNYEDWSIMRSSIDSSAI